MHIRTLEKNIRYIRTSPWYVFFRNAHVCSQSLTQEHIDAYQEVMAVSSNDPSLTAKDMINKGFSYLCSDKQAYYFSALVCFEKAQDKVKTDKLTESDRQKYNYVIECGIKEASSENESLSSFHFIK